MSSDNQAQRSSFQKVEILETQYQGKPFFYPEHSMIGECTADGQGWDTVLVPILRFLFPLHSKPIIVEVGTNIGRSLLQMEIAIPNAKFFCFEPVERFFEIAQMNIAANNWKNVNLKQMFLSDDQEEVLLATNASTASAVISDYREKIPQLQFVDNQKTYSTLLDVYFDKQDISFLKIDTDGYEFHVLKGGKQLLQRSKPHLFFEFDPRLLKQEGTDPERLLKFLINIGYEQFLVLSNFGEALAIESDPEQIINHALKTEYYVDLVVVHSGREATKSLTTLMSIIGDSYTTYLSTHK